MSLIYQKPEATKEDLAMACCAVLGRAAKRISNPRNGGKVHRGPTEISGIVEHAQKLGVSRIHLYYVIRGDRRSPRIEAYLAKHMKGRAA
jgi:hypothetical protein